MSMALVPTPSEIGLPLIPWRDPHRVSPEDLTAYIRELEDACLQHPRSADLRTCLGVAHAVNYDVYKSMDALEEAIELEPRHFWAQVKYAELHYRLRALAKAEEETGKAIDLATTPWQLSVARRQLKEIRMAARVSARNVTWNKPLTVPATVLSLMLLLVFVFMSWK